MEKLDKIRGKRTDTEKKFEVRETPRRWCDDGDGRGVNAHVTLHVVVAVSKRGGRRAM